MIGRDDEDDARGDGAEFPPALDLVAPVVGAIGLVAAAEFAGGPYLLALARLVVGARLPRQRERRDAARSLVSRAARARRVTR